jgi:RimJ/RimL family protein N-acetyltransferase
MNCKNQLIPKYKCMPKLILSEGALSVKAVEPGHIEDIRQWRNAQMDVLRQPKEISPSEQYAYYETHVWPEMQLLQPKNILLAYMENGKLIGYGGLVHIAWGHCRAEVSFLLDHQLAGNTSDYKRYFSSFLRLMKTLAFDHMGFERLFTETYATREYHIEILESTGFHREGMLKHHVKIEGQFVDSVIHGCLKSYE